MKDELLDEGDLEGYYLEKLRDKLLYMQTNISGTEDQKRPEKTVLLQYFTVFFRAFYLFIYLFIYLPKYHSHNSGFPDF